MKIKKTHQYIIIGGIGLILVILYIRKKAVLAVDKTRPASGGGGGGQVAEGMKVLSDFQKCRMNGGSVDFCQDMIPL